MTKRLNLEKIFEMTSMVGGGLTTSLGIAEMGLGCVVGEKEIIFDGIKTMGVGLGGISIGYLLYNSSKNNYKNNGDEQ